MNSLSGKVAVVAGATRGAGRGIACMLGEAGATVYCTGRSTREKRSSIGRPETIEETAQMVTEYGGVGLWAQVDHADPGQVNSLFERISREQHGRLDILVNDLSGDWNIEPQVLRGRKNNPQWKPFWACSLEKGLQAQEDGVQAHLITSYYAAQLMVPNGQGLIVEVTDGNHLGYNDCGVFYSLTKTSAILQAYLMAEELREHNVAVVALTPGDMLSERRLQAEVSPQSSWAEIRKTPGLAKAESCFYIGKAVVALATDPRIMLKSGRALSVGQLAQQYGFTDVDGTQPIWYRGEGTFRDNTEFQREVEFTLLSYKA
jgi:NAD(P)-dependent dehydrogenase (short-subunit alcohol dehydrogenase family)